jgi:N-acetylglutamate synthase-like GNAT family acetyltransferase
MYIPAGDVGRRGPCMDSSRTTDTVNDLVIRSYKASDHEAVSRLYSQGLLAGHIAPNDTGADIDNIKDAYLADPRNHFWVAESSGDVVGMIGVAAEQEHTAEIRRLRVDRDYQNTSIAAQLIETAVAHCKQHSYMKVVLDTRFEQGAAVDLFDRFGFQHSGTKPVHGKELLEFYLDLYRQSKPEEDGGRNKGRVTSNE